MSITQMRYLTAGALSSQLEDVIHQGLEDSLPQALRTAPNSLLIATLATDGAALTVPKPQPRKLVLTVSDDGSGSGGACP